jgi:hypothetical protein
VVQNILTPRVDWQVALGVLQEFPAKSGLVRSMDTLLASSMKIGFSGLNQKLSCILSGIRNRMKNKANTIIKQCVSHI